MKTNNPETASGTEPPSALVRISFNDILIILIVCLVTGLLILMPRYTSIDPMKVLFYEKNAGIIAFLGLCLYAVMAKRIRNPMWLMLTAAFFLVPALYINLLPSDSSNQALILSCIHLPLMLWCVYGIVYTDFEFNNIQKRVDFIKHNGDLAILGALLVLAGIALAGFTIALFSSIDMKIEKFYSEYIALWGAMAAPAVTAFIIRHYPKLTSKIAPLIATLFSPLVLLTLLVYLAAVLFAGKNPYTDRDFLIMFNLMLIGVMAIVVFSITERSGERRVKFNEYILFALVVVTLITDLVALSAIFYRLGEFGITANRIAVLGSNLLILGNIVLITIDLFRVTFHNESLDRVTLTTARYLPLYFLWTVVVVFGFPMIF
ncbi:MAG TPA: hypothetical protein VMV74_11445 [Bacteroidales bacterium]|nr:hypothetical protein [Bacteroidales bacterium]